MLSYHSIVGNILVAKSLKIQESILFSKFSKILLLASTLAWSSCGKKANPSFLCMTVHIGDMYSHDGNADEPEWVKTEREQFVEFRDKNRDGKMDKEETKDWILPSDYDHAEAEARHLVYESDQNKVSLARPQQS